MDIHELMTTANAMVTRGKGILAMDESTPTIGKRLQTVGVANTADNRAAYRTLLLGSPGLGDAISAAILYDETIRQASSDGLPFPELLRRQGIIVGIKVDTGAKALAGHPGEKVTEGLDGLRERLRDYAGLGARFCKWRAVIAIGPELPSRACIDANAHALARYAMLCQEAGLVPIVEPEVLIDGDHTLPRCLEVSVQTQRAVFEQLYLQGVAFEGMVLKPNMVTAGKQCAQQATVAEVAEQTLRCLRDSVPAALPGVAFLSGGQTDVQATAHLNAINRMAKGLSLPWRLTFSFARALQQPAMAAWRGDPSQVEAAQRLLVQRARLNSLASSGEYSEEMEREAA
jgi:fructose-bisphosphate aldolase class I